ncbi:MAG: glycosyltransferase [Acidimicrobiales bacterium]
MTRLEHRQRPPVVFISWGAVAGRSTELADALGGQAFALFPPTEDSRPPVLVRYLLSSLATLAILVRTDPRALIVTNPPILLACVAWSWAALRRIPLVLDSHPGSFGKQGDAVSARFIPVHRWLARHAASVLVTDDTWVSEVGSWGGKGLVMHEAPGSWALSPTSVPAPGIRPKVLFVCRFAGDEPVAEAIEAAKLAEGVDFLVTGRLEDLSPALREAAAPNVSFVGYLPSLQYRRLVEACDIVLTLTTESTSAMRAAYEAVYSGKVLVVSDWALDRALFPHAVHTANDARSIAASVEHAVASHAELQSHAARARQLQLERFDAQLAELATVLDLSEVPLKQAPGGEPPL